MTKRINKILWNGTEVPKASTQADGLDGLNLGELFIKNDPQEPGVYTRTTDGKVVSLGGLDEAKLEEYLTNNQYATTSDLDARIDALVNGAPAAYDTLKEIADVLANNINSIDDILTALGTKVSKDDFNTAIDNVNSSISALNTELSGKIDLKLDAATFNELFEKVQLEDGTWAIKAKLGLFSDGFISAKGSNVGGTSSEGGAVALYQLNDVLADGTGVSGAQNGAVFVYDATIGKWKGVAQSEIVPNLTGYATESWVLSQGFLTQHQDLSDYAKLSDIPVIPTTDINKGVTAYGWGDHSKVGYLTSITSALVTGALGYTPYNAANFTKANIKSTLGISDWALASSKPSYTTKEVAEDTNLYFTNARAVAALKSITDGLSSSITSNTTKITNLTTKVDDHIAVFNSMFKLVELSDGTISIQALYGLWSDGFISAKGANSSGGSSGGGGLITSLYRYADLGKTFADTNNDTFNAYTINKINTDLGNRISVLEGKATNVSFTQSLTSGTQIGTITIDGASKNIYAPTIPTSDINKGVTAYGWGNHASVGYITASASITGNAASASLIKPTTGTGVASSWVSLTSYTKVWGEAFNISSLGSDTGDIALYLRSGVYTKNSAELCVAIDGDFYAQTGSKKVLHEGNYTDYAYSKTTIDSKFSGLGTFAYKSSLAFADLTDKPTTIGGFGITDAYTKSQVDSALGGYLPLSGGTITSNNLRIGASNNYQSANLLIFNNTSETANYGTNIRHYYNNVYQGLLIYPNYGLYYSDNGTDYPLIHSGNIGSYSFIARGEISSNTDANQLLKNGAYLNATGNGSGNSNFPTAYSMLLNYAQSDRYVGQISIAADTMHVRRKIDTWSEWKEVAFTDSNVASATKLQTARSIWGQSFDGTGDVSGNLTLGYNKIYLADGNNSYYVGWNSNSQLEIKNYYDIIFNTSTERMRITKGGNVGIGTDNPQYNLDVNGALNAGVYYASTTNSIGNNTSGHFRFGKFDEVGGLKLQFGAKSDTNFAIINSEWNKALFVVDTEGNVTASGTIHSNIGIFSDGYVSAKGQNTSSDMRLKRVLNEVVLSVKDIANAPSMRFSWKNGGGVDVGSSAQYWQKLLPDAVKERDGMLEMQYANIALLSAIAIAKKVEKHEERIVRLEKENKELRNEIMILKGGHYA